LRAWARAKRPTPCSDWFTEKPFPELDAHRLGEDVLATILHRKCSNQSVEVGSRRGLSPLRRCSAPGRSCFECVTPSSVHSSPKSTGLRGKIGMIRCVFLRSINVSVVSNIVVTEMIEKIHPRHFLNLSCKEKIEPFSAKNRSPGICPKNHGRAEVRGGSASTIHVRIGTIWAFLPQESTGRFSIGVDGGALRPIPPKSSQVKVYSSLRQKKRKAICRVSGPPRGLCAGVVPTAPPALARKDSARDEES